jgi:hypothetical protein
MRPAPIGASAEPAWAVDATRAVLRKLEARDQSAFPAGCTFTASECCLGSASCHLDGRRTVVEPRRAQRPKSPASRQETFAEFRAAEHRSTPLTPNAFVIDSRSGRKHVEVCLPTPLAAASCGNSTRAAVAPVTGQRPPDRICDVSTSDRDLDRLPRPTYENSVVNVVEL